MNAAGEVLISGATGLVGSRLVPALVAAGAQVTILSRDPSRAASDLDGVRAHGWDGRHWPSDALSAASAVVHLAGEPVFGGPLTAARRARIRESRVLSTAALVEALEALPAPVRPDTLVCASAVGYYGSQGDTVLDETAGQGSGFLAEVCVDWEAAAERASALGVRVVRLRTGIVLAREGGALALMAMPFRFGLGGPLGDGQQWVPWIHADDLVRLILHLLGDSTVSGPVNAVAPDPVRNEVLTQAIARTLHRPALLRVPAFALRIALGELAGELLGSRRCVPRRAQEAGFTFAHPSLEGALAEELGKGA